MPLEQLSKEELIAEIAKLRQDVVDYRNKFLSAATDAGDNACRLIRLYQTLDQDEEHF